MLNYAWRPQLIFFSVRVAFNTPVGDIVYAFFGVFALRFALIVAIVAGPTWGFAWMTHRTLSIGAFMVHWESMPADVDFTPVAGVVAG